MINLNANWVIMAGKDISPLARGQEMVVSEDGGAGL